MVTITMTDSQYIAIFAIWKNNQYRFRDVSKNCQPLAGMAW